MKKIPIVVEDFSELIDNDYYYIHKSYDISFSKNNVTS